MKTVVKLIVALAVVAGLSGSSAVAQGGAQRFVTIFYEDESETTQVGSLVVYCDGHRAHYGDTTLYSETYEYTCP